MLILLLLIVQPLLCASNESEILDRLLKQALNPEVITNNYRLDGFGEQYHNIICAAIYAEIHHKPFVYTPFSSMEHDYHQEPDFLQKKENLINLIGNFPVNIDPVVQLKCTGINFKELFDDIANSINIEELKCLKDIKCAFYKNKKKSDYFENDKFHIAVHVRRRNQNDSRIAGTDTPDSYYLNLITSLRTIYLGQPIVFHIYSQGEEAEFKAIYAASDTVFHIDESIEFTFASLVFADVLATSASCFSYAAALISNGTIYYHPWWRPPLPGWNIAALNFHHIEG